MAGSKSSGNYEHRSRNWSFVVYPESAPENWRELLDEQHMQWIESPLHDSDVDANGEVKKAHWHIIMLFSSVKSRQQITYFSSLLNCPSPQQCINIKGSVRYMAHLDNPEKHRYSVNDIVAHGGADISDYFKATASERYIFIKEMCDFIRCNNIIEFQDLVDYAIVERFDTWFPLLCDNSAYIVGQYIKSQRNRQISTIVTPK